MRQLRLSRLLIGYLVLLNYPLLGQTFSEVALSRGLQHVAVASDFMGAAVAIFDYDNDGWQDVYLTGGLHSDKLFRNLGNGVYSDVTSIAGNLNATKGYKTTSVVTADLDNDGDREIIVGTARNMPKFIFRNDNGVFTHITPSTGVSTTKNTMTVVTGDFDLDGRMDIYIVNYTLQPRPILDGQGDLIGYNHTCSPNELYRNLGGLSFQEAGGSNGVMDTIHTTSIPPGPVNAGCGLAGLFTDVNGDYKPDIYVANDFGMFTHIGNAYYENNHPSAGFTDRRVECNLGAQIFGMGIAQGDYDKDGRLDIYVTNLGRHILYRQLPGGTFEDTTTPAGVENATDPDGLNVVGWGTAFFDYDNDSYEDLYVATGYVPAAKTYETSLDSENKLYHNLGNGTFEDVSSGSGANDTRWHRGMAVGDFDNDGDEDLLVTKLVSTGVPVQDYTLYYINDQQLGRHWLQVSLQGNGTSTNRDAFGSTVKVYYANTHGIKSLSGGSSHASQNSSVLHFGINMATTIDSVEVFWPGGTRTRVLNPPVDKHIRIVQGTPGFGILGCMDDGADNYDSEATVDYACFTAVPGCTNVAAGNYDPAANQDDGSCVITGIETRAQRVSVYPNPARAHVSVSMSGSDRAIFELLDVQGRVVFRSEFEGTATFQPGIRPGLYYYRVMSNHHVIQTGKVIQN